MADGDHEKDRLRDQLLELQEQNEKMEGLMNFLEEEKKRLQDKTERMTQAGKMGRTESCTCSSSSQHESMELATHTNE